MNDLDIDWWSLCGKLHILTLWVVGQRQQTDTRSSDPRPKDGYAAWISSEVTDVFTDPAQSLNLIQEAVVSLRRLVTSTEESWCIRGGKKGKAKIKAMYYSVVTSLIQVCCSAGNLNEQRQVPLRCKYAFTLSLCVFLL